MTSVQEILDKSGFDGRSFNPSDASGRTLRGACPNCGGSRRLLVFIDKPTPNWNHQCDLCGYKNTRLDKLPTDYYNIQIEGVPTEREPTDISAAVSSMEKARTWERYHANLTDENRKWLQLRGIPDHWQDHWMLGYINRRMYLHNGVTMYSPAYTIPKVDFDNRVVNIDYRLTDIPEDAGKYRSESGLPPAAFIADISIPEGNRLYIVEGAFKAMNLFLFLLENNEKSQVIGMPSVSSKLFLQYTDGFDKCFVLLDPDSVKKTKEVASQIGWKGSPVFMPSKIDDAILGGLSWTSFQRIIENSDL